MRAVPKSAKENSGYQLIAIVSATVGIQIASIAWGGTVVYGGALLVPLVLRLLTPLLLLRLCRLSAAVIGLFKPMVRGPHVLAAVGLAIVALPIQWLAGQVEEVYGLYVAAFGGAAGDWRTPLFFITSSVVSWEFLNRGFFLFGVASSLRECGTTDRAAEGIAIGATCAIETLFHLHKPPLEMLGIFVVSPILSWIALGTRSIWIPLALHLYVDMLFFVSIGFWPR